MKYLVKRTAQALLTFIAVLTLTFGLVRLMPGGPMDYLRAKLAQSGQHSSQEMQELMEIYTGVRPDQPLHIQFINYVINILHGDLGKSMWYDTAVSEILIDAMPWTIFISAVSLFFIFGIGITLGAIMAYSEGEPFDISASVLSIIITSVPFYVIAVILVWFLGYQSGIFPTGGRVNPELQASLNPAFITSVFHHAALPIASLVIAGFGNVALSMRGNSIQVLGEDYLRVARLRGLSKRRIGLRYVGRNAILPMYTAMMISIGSLFGGSVILETIFAYPGVGYYLFQALSARDYPLLMGAFIFITTGVIVGVYIADLTYGWIDPRTESSEDRETFGKSFSLRRLTVRIRRTLAHLLGSDPDPKWNRPPSSARVASTGGLKEEDDDSIFQTVSESTMTPRERLYQTLDEWVVAPFKVFWDDIRARVGLIIVLTFVVIGTVGVVLVRQPLPSTGPALMPPFQNLKFPLGTDGLGRGIFAQIVHATPPMLKMITSGAVFATGMATVWGIFAGYKSGIADRVMMAIADIVLTIPGLPLIIVVAGILEPKDPFVVGIILSINAWAGFARSLRSQVLSTRTETYVEAARTIGISTPNILIKDVLPNVMPLIMVNFVTAARTVIISSVGLYFLGILPFSTLNWGVMMNLAYKNGGALYNLSAAHWFAIPMVTIVLLSLGLLLLGQGMDRIFNPRIRARHAKSAVSEDESTATSGATVTDGGTERQ